MSMYDYLGHDDDVRELLKEREEDLDEKRREIGDLEDKIDDLNEQLLQIQLLRNGDVHLIGSILRILNNNESDNAVSLIRQEISRWYGGGEKG